MTLSQATEHVDIPQLAREDDSEDGMEADEDPCKSKSIHYLYGVLR